jgi:hypothetical protein
MHWHPRNITYVKVPGRLCFTKSDGAVSEVELTSGMVASSGETSHAVENIGESTVEVIQVELKD